jgi:hypothetical protein
LLEEGQLEDAKMEIDDILEDNPEGWEPFYPRATCLLLEASKSPPR